MMPRSARNIILSTFFLDDISVTTEGFDKMGQLNKAIHVNKKTKCSVVTSPFYCTIFLIE